MNDPGPATDPSAALAGRILDAFGERAAAVGIRGVVMAELVRGLGISSKTLYKHFGSKAELVSAVVEREAARLARAQEERSVSGMSPARRIYDATSTWLEFTARFQDAFWRELERDYPEAYQRFRGTVLGIHVPASRALAEQLRNDIDPKLALRWLHDSIDWAVDPVRCDRLGLTRRESVRQVIEAWARACLREPERIPFQ